MVMGTAQEPIGTYVPITLDIIFFDDKKTEIKAMTLLSCPIYENINNLGWLSCFIECWVASLKWAPEV